MPLIVETLGPVAHLRLNRPQRLNALTLVLAQTLLAAVQKAVADPAVRVLLLSGEGRAFCAGKDRDEPPSQAFVDTLQALAAALLQSPKPVVAAVHGWVVGAGLELMLNADLAIAARSARFALPEAALGLLGTGGVGALLPCAVGLPRAKGLLMLGTEFTAADAERCGLLWAVVDDAELPAQALAVAQQLAGRDAKVLAEIKATLHHETLGDVPALLAREAASHQRIAPHNKETQHDRTQPV